jgi:hypothetical protein
MGALRQLDWQAILITQTGDFTSADITAKCVTHGGIKGTRDEERFSWMLASKYDNTPW